MAVKIRLARGGAKKRPFYRIVAADSRMPRDGRFIEKLGTYNPLLPKGSPDRVTLDLDRIKHWLSLGAKPTDRVARFLEAAGEMDTTVRNNPVKAQPGAKAQAKLEAIREAADEPVATAEPNGVRESPATAESSAAEDPVTAGEPEATDEAASDDMPPS